MLSKNQKIGLEDINIAVKDSRVSPADRRKLSIDLPHQGISLQEIEHSIIKQVLDMFNWNKSEAARYLSISRARLRRMIEAAGLEQTDAKPEVGTFCSNSRLSVVAQKLLLK